MKSNTGYPNLTPAQVRKLRARAKRTKKAQLLLKLLAYLSRLKPG